MTMFSSDVTVSETVSAQTEVAVKPVQSVDLAVAVEQKDYNSMFMVDFSEKMAELGYEGLELSGMSFDRVKLHEGTFKLGAEEFDLGSSFDCSVLSSRRLYVVRQHTGQDAKTFYSYDSKGLTNIDGDSAEETLKEWAEEGYETPDIKCYLEAVVTLVNRDDEHDGNIVVLSVPPASRKKLGVVIAQGMHKYKTVPENFIVKCQVGKQVGEGTKKFRPWIFRIAGLSN